MDRKYGSQAGPAGDRDEKGRFGPGNRGKPAGARNKATQAALALLEGEGEALARKAVEMALAGDVTALRLCLERLVPVRRSATIQFDLPALEEANDEPAAARAVLEAMANGRVVPADAEVALKVIASWRQVQGRLEDRRHAEAWLGPLLMPPP